MAKGTPADGDVVTVQAAALHLGRSANTLRDWVKLGLLEPAAFRGSRALFRYGDFARLAAARPPARKPGHLTSGSGTPPAPADPCYADPGSEARVRELERRAAAGRALWHEQDERIVVESWLGRSGRAPQPAAGLGLQ